MKVKYKCPEHGVFAVDLPSVGASARYPAAQPCPTCSADGARCPKETFSISGATYARVQAYCKARKISVAKFIAEITKDL